MRSRLAVRRAVANGCRIAVRAGLSVTTPVRRRGRFPVRPVAAAVIDCLAGQALAMSARMTEGQTVTGAGVG